ncbi:MAG: cytochrome c biogenesis protein CcsA [Planctomycetes bacterium]|nr:cytochrome c biogenesis protein CcsA [Planctomycetota bacterium]
MTYLGFGSNLVAVALGLAALTVILSVVGIVRRDRRCVDGARNAMTVGGLAVAGAAACLVAGFFRGAYDIEYIYHYSERKLSAAKKFAGLWAGLDGSILFWASILGVIGTVLALGFRKKNIDPARRRLEPYVYAVFGTVQLFFLYVNCIVASPFAPVAKDVIEGLTQAGLADRGMPSDGRGLNPLLDTYWMMIHPPSVYLGFILYTVPFAYGAAALLAGEFSTAWIKATRGWTMLAWLFNTNGIILGGLWAYEVLGWGGYWAWDPVENASFLPWFTGTAFLHSVMVQERRDMLRVWNAILVCGTFILSIFGTYLTRSGVVSSVHAFGSGEVGDWFKWFLFGIIFFTVFLIVLRGKSLQVSNTIDNLLSREAVFVLNNFVLIALAIAISVLTLWPKITFEFMNRSISVGVPVFNRVCVPLFVLLFFFTAVGPALAWVKTSKDRIIANLLGPTAASLVLAPITQWFVWTYIRGGAQGDHFTWAQQIYPTFTVIFLSWLILTSLTWEVVRTVWNAAKGSGRGLVGAFVRLITFQNRRYGGYLVHVGIAVLAMGVVISSTYRITTEVQIGQLETARVGPYDLKVGAIVKEPARAGQVYNATRAPVSVTRDGVEVASLMPEKRNYAATGHRQERMDTTEVEIARLRGEDVYVYFDHQADNSRLVFTVFRNPCMWLVWIGWITMIVGGGFAALPLGGKKVGLA